MIIDMFSDTVTKPTQAMLQAMVDAPVGDEQRRDDPTVNRLQRRVAELLETEAALLMPSATMANQVAAAVHCDCGTEIICHQNSHVFHFEAGGLAAHARAQVMPLQTATSFFTGKDVENALRPHDPHYPVSRLVVVENTSNLGGGMVWPDEAFSSVVAICAHRGLKLHIDGARLLNAAVARGVGPAHWSRRADTVQICFSKGLGCPFGAVLAGSAEFVERARRIKQSFGGALRQAGIVAGAMLYALDHHVSRLALDHQRLRDFAQGIGSLPGIRLFPYETNILYFQHEELSATRLAAKLKDNGLSVSVLGPRLRVCSHLDVADQHIERAIAIVRTSVEQLIAERRPSPPAR
jgi:threonine aldolase